MSLSKRAQWFEVPLPGSPEEAEENKKCILELKPFSSFPHLFFERVKVGASKECIMYINNPLNVSQTVYVEKFPFEKGFHIEKTEINVPPLQELPIVIVWNPDKSVNCRETVFFKTSFGAKTQAFLHGIAFSPKKEKKRKTWHQKKDLPKIPNQVPVTVTIKSQMFVPEEKKENFNFSPEEISNQSSLFSIDQSKIFSDSPSRRQTYTINSMFKNRRNTEILSVPCEESDNLSKRKETFTLSEFNPTPLKELDIETNIPQNVNDSLMSDQINDSLDGSCLEKTCESPVKNDNLSYGTYAITSISDKINVWDSSGSKFYFNDVVSKPKVSEEKIVESFCDVTIDKIAMHTFCENVKNGFPFIKKNIKSLTDELEEADCTKKAKEARSNETYFYPTDKVDFINVFNSNLVSSEDRQFDHNPVTDKDFQNNDSLYSAKNAILRTNDILANNSSVSQPCFQAIENINKVNPIAAIKGKNLSNICSNFKSYSSFDIPFTPKVSSKEINIPCKKRFHSVKVQVPSKRSIRQSPVKSRNFKIKSPLKAKGIFKRKEISNMEKSENLGRVKPIRSVPRRLTLRKEKLLEKMCQKNPFASTNVYYDEYWMEKQETAFTNWLNFILTPNDDLISSEDIKVNSAQVWIESMKDNVATVAPTKEDLSFKAYTAAKKLNRLRKSSFTLYQSDSLASVINKIEKEVDMKKIVVRKDRAIHADVGIKKDLLEMLLSYNPLWLRIGLETIYGEIICLKNNRDILGLSRFIIFRFLSNPEITAKFTHPSVPNYYKPGYDEEIKRFMLKKFLLLVYFLDVAKNARLIDYNPCLFCKTSKFKCSRDFLLTFSREYLSGEGDVTKHLRYLGCTVTYQQTPLDEFDYAVRNISSELRCGLRLGRVTELLLQDWSIPNTLRGNTINRVNKIYNNDVILKALKKASIEIEGNIDARDIVDGHREKTLSLVWQIIFKAQVSKLLNKEILIKENIYLKQNLKLRADCAAFDEFKAPDVESEECDTSLLKSKFYEENEVMLLLLQWCQNVCAHYKLKVINFTSSFSDGRALCLLLHHYHPNLLPYEKIKQETSCSYITKRVECDESENPFMDENDKLSSKIMKEMLQNEKDNWDLAFSKFQEIGQVPILSFPSNASNRLPDEKVIIIMVSYLNVRLMELSIEIRAARTIQLAYRRFQLKKKQEKLKIEIAAAKLIQGAWRKYLSLKKLIREKNAALIIQCCWRMYSAKKQRISLKIAKEKQFMDTKAALIQAFYRGYKVRKHLAKCQQSAIILQKNIRMLNERTRYLKLKSAVLKMEDIFLAKKLGYAERQKYLQLKNTCIKLQAYCRGINLTRYLKKKTAAAVVIQSYYKMWSTKRQYLKLKLASLCLQRKFRSLVLAKKVSQEYQNIRKATIRIQKWYIHTKRKQLENNSAKKIQQWWKACLLAKKTRFDYLQFKKCVIILQSQTRRLIAQKKYRKKKEAIIIIQKNIRRVIVRKEFLSKKVNAIYIQNWWRTTVLSRNVRSSYLSSRNKLIFLQSVIRRWIDQRVYKKQRHCAILIQKNIRMMIARKNFLMIKSSAQYIQAWWRAYLFGKKTRSSFLLSKKRIVLLQSLTRKFIAQRAYIKQKQSAVVIQKNLRRMIARKKYLIMKSSALSIQIWWRAILIGKSEHATFMKIRQQIILIQSIARQFIAQKAYKQKKQAAITIQKNLRMLLARKKFCKLKSSSLNIQLWWRARLLGERDRASYIVRCKSVLMIQTHVRGWIARKSFNDKRRSAVLIQKTVRKFVARKNFCQLREKTIYIQRWWKNRLLSQSVREKYLLHKESAIKIQTAFRKYQAQKKFKRLKRAVNLLELYYLGKKQRNEFLNILNKVIKIQAYYRCYASKKKYLSQKHAAITIQAAFKKYKCRKHYFELRTSAIKIQRQYRLYRCMCSDRKNYLSMKKGFTKLQAIYRGIKTRKDIVKLNEKATTIQSYYKMYYAKHNYTKIRKACLIIQRRFRAHQKMMALSRDYQIKKKAAISIQAAVRSYLSRKHYLKIQQAAIRIQSFVRMKIAQRKYYNVKKRIVRCQQIYRANHLMKIQRLNYVKQKLAVTYLQSKVRGYIARKKYLALRCACIVIQSLYRKQKQRKAYLRLYHATVNIQKRYKAISMGKTLRSNYLLTRNVCIKIQSFWKMFRQRKKYRELKSSSIIIQTRFRALKAAKRERQNYLKIQKSCITIQSYFKMKKARTEFLKSKQACIIIQSSHRMFIARKNYLMTKKAISVLQTHFMACIQGRIERRKYLDLKKSVVLVQTYVRSYLAKKAFITKKTACIKIQAQFRSYLCCKEYKMKKQAAIILQDHVRAFLKGKKSRETFLQKRHLIIKTQALCRGWLVRKYISKQNSSAVKIQASFRGFICRRNYLIHRKAVVKLQNAMKSYLIGKKIRSQYLMMKQSATIIQSHWRGYTTRKSYLKQKQAAILIQSHVKGLLQRKKIHKLKQSVYIIQEYYLAFKEAQREFQLYQAKKRSCLKIQSYWRNYLIKKQLKRKTDAAIIIQQKFRKWRQHEREKELIRSDGLTAYQQRQWFIKIKSSIIGFQRSARSYIMKRREAAIVIQSGFRKFLVKKIFKREKAALKIQTMWRGFVVRRSITDKQILAVQNKIKLAKSDECQRLIIRTKIALDILKGKNLTKMLAALQTLDVCTRLSPVCCVEMEQSGGLCILVQLIQCCNRSEPHKEIIMLSMNIFLNIAKFNRTMNSVWEQDNILDVTQNLMKRYRDKSSLIFNKCCSLLYIFCQDPCKAKTIRSCRYYVNHIESLHSLIERQYKLMEQKSNKPNVSTSRKQHTILDVRESVQIDPEWLLGKHRKREFQDPFVAISSLMKCVVLKENSSSSK